MIDQQTLGHPYRHILVVPGTPAGDLAGLERPKPVEEEEDWRKRGFIVKPKTIYLGRNEPCHCKSGKKYKHCCLNKDESNRFIRK